MPSFKDAKFSSNGKIDIIIKNHKLWKDYLDNYMYKSMMKEYPDIVYLCMNESGNYNIRSTTNNKNIINLFNSSIKESWKQYKKLKEIEKINEKNMLF